MTPPPLPLHASRFTFHAPRLTILLITLLAFFLRVWQLADIPLGWRDDELINVLVISQKIVDGDWQVYYADASGNEALYHALNALMLHLFGANVVSFRLVSAVLGTLTVPLLYVVGRKWFHLSVGLIASAGLAVSFWGLMYARFGLRQVMTPLLALLVFHFFWRAWHRPPRSAVPDSLLVALFTALGFYTYFASRGLPLIFLAFAGYLFLYNRELFWGNWKKWLLMGVGTAVLLIPLFLNLRQQPEAEARVAELAAPLIRAREGDFSLIAEYTWTTLRMFHHIGDNEWLYNISDRPIFTRPVAFILWVGVAGVLWDALHPQRKNPASAFLFFWFLAGISPGFISVPPASLGHTIVAQPAVYLLLGWPLGRLALARWPVALASIQKPLLIVASLVLLGSTAFRDLPDYFQVWPKLNMVRFLYHSDVKEMAAFLTGHPEWTDFALAGPLDGPWGKLALTVDLPENRVTAVRPRWFNPERAMMIEPATVFVNAPSPYEPFLRSLGVQVGGYELYEVMLTLPTQPHTCFQNGLCLVSAVFQSDVLQLGWRVERPLDLPPIPLISNPPPPGVYAGPRLWVFAQLQDSSNQFLVGTDGLWVDPTTLYPGDVFVQQHGLVVPEGQVAKSVVFGLYDPMTGERILTEDGQDFLRLQIEE